MITLDNALLFQQEAISKYEQVLARNLVEAMQEAEKTAREKKQYRKALNLLCPRSLQLALKALEGDSPYDMNIDEARMHITCELERMLEATSSLNEQLPTRDRAGNGNS